MTAIILTAFLLEAVGLSGQNCEPDGDVEFLCGPLSPEDLAPIPDSPWIVVSSMVDEGHLYLADSRDYNSIVAFPTHTTEPKHDVANYDGCPGPVSRAFRPHGLYLQPGINTNHRLYVVGHGARESIEVFNVDAGTDPPNLTWVGCVIAPKPLNLNSVVALPEGGFAATSPRTSDIWKWSTDTNWQRVSGSKDIDPNGLEISRDGQWFYVGGYGKKSLILLSRGQTPIQTKAIQVGFHIDNVRWGPGETLLVAGHIGPTRESISECFLQQKCNGIESRVAKIDLGTFTAKEIIRYPSNDLLILGTVAIQVGHEIWVGGVSESNRIARFPIQRH